MVLIENLIKKFPAAAEYLIQIFIINRDYGLVKNSVIAERLGVSKPAVTQAMNRLKKFGLIEQDLYGAINLTSAGRMTASSLLKRHYLIEHMLIGKLDYNWVKSDIEASRLQSFISDDFAEFLYDKLGRPETCPHGNPFPGSGHEKEIINAPLLNSSSEGDSLVLIRITEEGEAEEGLLQFCYENQLRPGVKFDVQTISGIEITILRNKSDRIKIPLCFASFLGVKMI